MVSMRSDGVPACDLHPQQGPAAPLDTALGRLDTVTRQLARGMGSFSKECGCSRPTRCQHPYTIRFRDALGEQREEAGFGTQDEATERLTQIYAEKKKTAPVPPASRCARPRGAPWRPASGRPVGTVVGSGRCPRPGRWRWTGRRRAGSRRRSSSRSGPASPRRAATGHGRQRLQTRQDGANSCPDESHPGDQQAERRSDGERHQEAEQPAGDAGPDVAEQGALKPGGAYLGPHRARRGTRMRGSAAALRGGP